MLITSIGSGAIVGRTGRYKIFPVLGTAIMALAFVLLSLMNVDTPTWLQSVYLFILGTGIGLCMQVLVLTVQNTASFSDLGVATSGVTFFRTIGSSFGAAIFGSLFTNFLTGRIAAALAESGAPPEAAQSPKALHQLSPEMAAPIVAAYSDSLGKVFLCAAPVALGRLRRLAVPQGGAAAPARRDLGDRPRRGLRHARGRVVGEDARGGGRPDVPRLPGDPVAQPRRPTGQPARCGAAVGADPDLPA